MQGMELGLVANLGGAEGFVAEDGGAPGRDMAWEALNALQDEKEVEEHAKRHLWFRPEARRVYRTVVSSTGERSKKFEHVSGEYASLKLGKVSGFVMVSRATSTPGPQCGFDAKDYVLACFSIRKLWWADVGEKPGQLLKVLGWPTLTFKSYRFESKDGCPKCHTEIFMVDQKVSSKNNRGHTVKCDCGELLHDVRLVHNTQADAEAFIEQVEKDSVKPSMYHEDAVVAYPKANAPDSRLHLSGQRHSAELMGRLAKRGSVAVAMRHAQKFDTPITDVLVRRANFAGSFWVPSQADAIFGLQTNLREYLERCNDPRRR